MVGLRERKRLQLMQQVQERAVELFDEHGFHAVSVERVAAEAEVSPVSVYRWFGTKEGLVLWDDYDPPLLERVAEHLDDRPPLEAVRDAVVTELGRVYDVERARVLARAKLICREPALAAANRSDLAAFEEALAAVLGGTDGDAFERRVLAAVAVAVLSAAVTAWQAEEGHVPLAELVTDGFVCIGVDR